MRFKRTYYEILGLPQTATAEEIKRRYRELARKFHPDVAQDKSFGHRAFVQITEAYKTLSDPLLRREYDRKLRAQGAARPRAGAASPAESAPSGESAARDRLIRDAELAFVRGRFADAAGICRQAIRQGRSRARAHEILGDIYRIRGQVEEAISEYTLSLQYAPSSAEVSVKLERLLKRERRRPPPRTEPAQEPEQERRAGLIAGANFFGWGLAFLVLLLLTIYPGKPAPFFSQYLPFVDRWSWNLAAAVLVDSFLLGVVMCVTGFIDHPDEELIFDGGGRSILSFPSGLFLLIFGGFFFWGAAVLYLLVSLLQESLSGSIANVFAAVTIIVLAAALAYPEGRRQVMLFSGNLAFIGMLVGWYIGAVMRPIEG